MAKGVKETKTANLMLRVRPSIKRKAELLATESDRSLVNLIERLIEEAYAKGHEKRDG